MIIIGFNLCFYISLNEILLFISEESPYAHLLDNRLWQEAAELFVRDACALMGLSVESPLAVAVNAGCTALPALLNIKQVSTGTNKQSRASHFNTSKSKKNIGK